MATIVGVLIGAFWLAVVCLFVEWVKVMFGPKWRG